MAAKWIEVLTGSLDQKRQYRHHQARLDALPHPYKDAAKAVQRYLTYFGAYGADGATLVAMIGDHADLWERAAADGTPIRDMVGDDPVSFAEAFAEAYSAKQWIDKERDRLTAAIDALTGDLPTEHDGSQS